MPNLFFADLVRERCHDGGAGPLTPTGAMPGHRRFADAVPVGASFHYAVAGVAWSAEWENGTGHIDEAGRLVRDSVAASSNGGAPVDFAPGLKTIALTVGAAWFAGQQADAAATAGALAGKQPLSTGHVAAANGADGDTLTVRRGEGWVNIPLTSLAWRDGAGRLQASAPLACADGTAAAPSISFGADTDTGLFRPGANALSVAVGGNERFTIASTGSITTKLRSDAFSALNLDTERAAGEGGVMLRFRDPAGVKGYLGYSAATDVLYVVNQANADLTFSTNNASRTVLQANGVFRPASDNVYQLGLNTHRWSTTHSNIVSVGDGSAGNPCIRFNADAGTGLYRQATSTLGFACGGVAKLVLETVVLRPGADNAQNFGWSGGRWMNIYAVGGTINTSDAREKTWRGPMSAAERTAARRIVAELGFFQWNDAIARKGPDGARLHFGVRAQTVWDIMAEEGLIGAIVPGEAPSSRYAFLCWDGWEAPEDEAVEDGAAAGDRFGIRADQLALFLIAAQEARLAVLEAAA